MRYILVLLCWVAILTPAAAQHKIMVGIGSSTLAGFGANPQPPGSSGQVSDSCWASILKRYYLNLGIIDTLYNLGRPGSTTYDGLPTGSPYPGDTTFVDNNYNVTYALDRDHDHADIVIVNYANNDLDSAHGHFYTLAQTMNNLQTIYNTVVSAGKICFITTTQPRTVFATGIKQLLKVERDSIMNRFGIYAINFYNAIVAADSLNINPLYFFDGTHVNNAGHRALYEAARAATSAILIPNPLPITLTGFTAVSQQQKVLLSWTGMNQTGAPDFIVQRSADGTSFEDQAQIQATGSAMAHNYSWTDQKPLAGKSFYRIKVSEQSQTDHYSPIIAVIFNSASWNISKLYRATGSTWNIEIQSGKTTNFHLRVIDAGGRQYLQQSVTVSSPSRLVPLNLSGLAGGQYFVQLVSDQGEVDVRAIQKQ